MLEIILVLGQRNEGGAHLVSLVALPSHPQESRYSVTDESTGGVANVALRFAVIHPSANRTGRCLTCDMVASAPTTALPDTPSLSPSAKTFRKPGTCCTEMTISS